MPYWAQLNRKHNKKEFDCGYEISNEWLKKKAWQWQKRHATKVWVLSEQVDCTDIIAFYSLSSRTVRRADVPQDSRLGRFPFDLPSILIGQVAVGKQWQGKGIGRFVMMNALFRCFEVASQIGLAVVEIDASDPQVCAFYEKFGFASLLDDTQHMYLGIDAAAGILVEAGMLEKTVD